MLECISLDSSSDLMLLECFLAEQVELALEGANSAFPLDMNAYTKVELFKAAFKSEANKLAISDDVELGDDSMLAADTIPGA